MTITVEDIIIDPSLMNDEDFVYAKRVDGKFLKTSEVVILSLTEEEKDMLTTDFAKIRCPGFEYFLEAYIIKDMLSDFDQLNVVPDMSHKVNAVIHYAEFDA